eukprot:COSAG02_NODE_1486_length_12372_cov_150.906869_1_plen_63_part_10
MSSLDCRSLYGLLLVVYRYVRLYYECLGFSTNNKAIKAYPRAHMHRDSDLRVGMSAAPGYSGH